MDFKPIVGLYYIFLTLIFHVSQNFDSGLSFYFISKSEELVCETLFSSYHKIEIKT